MPFFRQCSENDLRSTHSTREEKNSVVLCPNGQFRALEKPPFWPSFSTGALSFRECPFFWRAASSGGLRDDTAAGNVASLTFIRKCLLRAFDCGCGNGFLLAEDRGLSRSRFYRPSPGFNRHSPVSFAPCFGSQIREWLSL